MLCLLPLGQIFTWTTRFTVSTQNDTALRCSFANSVEGPLNLQDFWVAGCNDAFFRQSATHHKRKVTTHTDYGPPSPTQQLTYWVPYSSTEPFFTLLSFCKCLMVKACVHICGIFTCTPFAETIHADCSQRYGQYAWEYRWNNIKFTSFHFSCRVDIVIVLTITWAHIIRN